MILLVTPPDDDHSRAVADLLKVDGRAVEVIDVASVSLDTSVELAFGSRGSSSRVRISSRSGAERIVDLGLATTGWWRRVPAPRITRSVTLAEVDGSPIESTESLESATASLDLAWINDPIRDRAARRRPRVWSAANGAGLRLPETVVTSDRAAAHRFRDSRLTTGVVVKPFIPRLDEWTGCRIPDDEIGFDEALDGFGGAVVVQEFVAGRDVRVIVVDGAQFATEFRDRDPHIPLDISLMQDSTGGAVDARRIELPAQIGAAITAMITRLGLVYAAVDFRVTDDGAVRFLDLDPTAPWLLLEELTGWPITEAVVGALASRDTAALPLSGRSAALR